MTAVDLTARLVQVGVNSEVIKTEFDYTQANHIRHTGEIHHLNLAQTETLLMDHGSDYSVFCFDGKTDEVIFVKTTNGIDLYQSPFIYMAQRNHAVEALYLPVVMAWELADAIAATFPSDFKLVHLYSVGRCGSTLLCKAMDATRECQSLSEPDIFTNLTHYTVKESHLPLEEHRARMVSIFRVAFILLAHFCLCKKPEKKTVVLKYRSNCLPAAEPMQLAYPSAKTIFLYRDAFSHNESFTRAFLIQSYWKYWLYATLKIDKTDWNFTQAMIECGWNDTDDFMNNVFTYGVQHGYLWTSFCFWISSMEMAARFSKPIQPISSILQQITHLSFETGSNASKVYFMLLE